MASKEPTHVLKCALEHKGVYIEYAGPTPHINKVMEVTPHGLRISYSRTFSYTAENRYELFSCAGWTLAPYKKILKAFFNDVEVFVSPIEVSPDFKNMKGTGKIEIVCKDFRYEILTKSKSFAEIAGKS